VETGVAEQKKKKDRGGGLLSLVVLLEAVDDSFFSFFYFVLPFLSVFVPSTSLFLLFLTVKVLLLKIGRTVAAGGGYVDDRWFAMVILLFSYASLCFFFLVFFCSLCQQGFSNLCSGFVVVLLFSVDHSGGFWWHR
jgi:hypothetical protein